MTNRKRLLIGLVVGAAVTPIAAVFAVTSMGAGHGHYALAKLLFPYSMLLTTFANDTISKPLIALALAQFPFYGLALASRGDRQVSVTAGALALLHFAFAGVCFLGLIPNFS